jgi:hypothetical protein
VTLSGNRLITTTGEQRTERDLTDDETLTTYREVFSITLDRVPTVRQR